LHGDLKLKSEKHTILIQETTIPRTTSGDHRPSTSTSPSSTTSTPTPSLTNANVSSSPTLPSSPPPPSTSPPSSLPPSLSSPAPTTPPASSNGRWQQLYSWMNSVFEPVNEDVDEDEDEDDKNWLENENGKWHDGTINQNENILPPPPKIESLKEMPNPNVTDCLNVIGETIKTKAILITLFILILFYILCSVAIILAIIIMAIILTIKGMIAMIKFCCKMKKANFGIF